MGRVKTTQMQPLTDPQRQFAEDNVKLLYKIGNKYADMFKDSLERDDCLQIAALGYIKAIQTYDAKRCAAFSTYAGICIRSEIFKHTKLSRCKCRDSSNNVSLDAMQAIDAGIPDDMDVEAVIIRKEEIGEAKKTVDAILQRYPKNRELAGLIMSGLSVIEAAKVMGRKKQGVYRRIWTMRDRCKHFMANG